MAVSRFFNLVRFHCSTVGTGDIEIGLPVDGFNDPVAAGVPDGVRVSYAIADGTDSEVCVGIYDAGTGTITRTTLASTDGGSPLSLTGNAEVALLALAEDLAPGINPVDTIASASTVDLGASLGLHITISGATTITSFGTGANKWRFVTFSGALTLTHNATTLILPGAANITTVAGDTAIFVSDDDGNWRCIAYIGIANANRPGIVRLADNSTAQAGSSGTTAVTPASLAAAAIKQGKHTIYIPAGAMTPRVTNGAARVISELATNDVMLATLDFDQATEEGAGFWVWMPKSWDASTISFQPIWTTGGGTGGVVWSLGARAYADDDALDQAMGTAGTSTDTRIADNDMHVGPESSAITVGGSPAAERPVYFEVRRVVANGSDTLTADAKLIGIKVFLTLNVANDA